MINTLIDELEKNCESNNTHQILKNVREIEIEFEDNLVKRIINLLYKYPDSEFIQENLLILLEKTGGKLTIYNLADALKMDNIKLRNKILDSILNIEKYYPECLRALISNDDKNIRKIALDGLFRFSNELAAPAIKQCLYDKDINIKITAVEYIGKKKIYSEKDEILQIFLNDENLMLRIACIETLGEIGDNVILNIISDFFNNEQNTDKNYLLLSYLKMVSKIGNHQSFSILSEHIDFFLENYISDFIENAGKMLERNNVIKLPVGFAAILIDKLKSNNLNDNDKVKLLFFIAKYNFREITDLCFEILEKSAEFTQSAVIDCISEYGGAELIIRLDEFKNKTESEDLKYLIDDTILKLKK